MLTQHKLLEPQLGGEVGVMGEIEVDVRYAKQLRLDYKLYRPLTSIRLIIMRNLIS